MQPLARNLDPRLLDQRFDPGNAHSVPYVWGTTGIGYDKKKLGPIDSWHALFDPKYAGRILMLDDPREAFGAALKLMGKSINEKDPAVLRQAAEMLKAQKKLVRTYNSSDFANLLAAGDVDLAQGWSGEVAEVVSHAPDRLALRQGCEGVRPGLAELEAAHVHPVEREEGPRQPAARVAGLQPGPALGLVEPPGGLVPFRQLVGLLGVLDHQVGGLDVEGHPQLHARPPVLPGQAQLAAAFHRALHPAGAEGGPQGQRQPGHRLGVDVGGPAQGEPGEQVVPGHPGQHGPGRGGQAQRPGDPGQGLGAADGDGAAGLLGGGERPVLLEGAVEVGRPEVARVAGKGGRRRGRPAN